jgi:hypothetical protein
LIGQQLPAVLDAFEQWEGKHGSGSSTLLLQNLAHRCDVYCEELCLISMIYVIAVLNLSANQ